ncbi:MAG TPA: tetratricopeptide repeat protein [Flavobacteriales bacterium]|nr:tetratricopeptide repeat protein [Flavobacteriales bacterium]
MNDRLEQLRALLADEPRDGFLRYAIALELKRLGKNAEAIVDLQALVREEPEHIATYYQLATLYAEAGRIEEAVATCDAGALRCVVTGDRKTRAELLSLKANLRDEE